MGAAVTTVMGSHYFPANASDAELQSTFPAIYGRPRAISPSSWRTRDRCARRSHARIDGPINLHDLAQAAGVSGSHFNRLFERSVGMTPHHYVVRARIERAKELLLQSDTAVADVAAALGFADQSHSANVCRKHTSMTPRALRNAVER